MQEITSIRAVYALMSFILFFAWALQSWLLVLFVVAMLQVGVIWKKCPSLWLFEKLGFKKSEL